MDMDAAFGRPSLKRVVVLTVGGILVTVVFLGILVATGVIEVQRPTVQTVTTSWGTVTDHTTRLKARVIVSNPNPVAIPSVLSLSYSVMINDVTLANGSKPNIGLSKGQNTIVIEPLIRNEKIDEWWITHVNNGGRSTLRFSGTVTGPFGFSKSVSRTRTIETDLLGKMPSGSRTVTLDEERFLVLSEQRARWGHATENRTPIVFSATVHNVHDYDVTLDGFVYKIEMNGITMGRGTTDDGFTVAPGEREKLRVSVGLNTSKMSEWWESHLRSGETSTLSIAMYGIIEEDGERHRIPITLVDRRIRFQTHLLGDEGTTTRVLPSNRKQVEIGNPTLLSTERRWGEVTNKSTEVRTVLRIYNPNSPSLSSLLSVKISQEIYVNDIQIADATSTIETIEPGNASYRIDAFLNNSKVPAWWARHINNGERSTLRIQTSAVADVGFTKVTIPTRNRTQSVETDMLAGIETETNRRVSISGRDVLIVHERSATWGTATTRRTPLTLSLTVENTARRPVTLSQLEYEIRFNDVVVGDAVAPESYTIAPGERRTIRFSLVIDSQRMDEWWVTHVRNNETTIVDFDATIVARSAGRTRTVRVASRSPETTFTTSFLNTTSESAPRNSAWSNESTVLARDTR